MPHLQKIASVQYVDTNGQRVTKGTPGARKLTTKSAKWYGVYTFEGVKHRIPLARDKSASQAMLNELVKRTERREAGLIDPYEDARKIPLAKHVADYRAALLAKGATVQHANKTANRCKLLFDGINARVLADLRSHDAERWLADQRARGLSTMTANYYATAAKSFGNWLVRDKRAPMNPFAHVNKLQAFEQTFERRALSLEECSKLIHAAERSPTTFRGLNGPARAMLYRSALGTGFRASELASLTVKNLSLNASTPCIVLGAANSKRRKADVQPISRELADALTGYASSLTKAPECPAVAFPSKRRKKGQGTPANARDAKLWPGTWHVKGAEMIRRDVKAAGVELDATNGTLDFHALRHTFISNLAKAGIHPRTAQELARHSDIKLTMSRYTHLGLHDLAAAVGSLPALETPRENSQAATGTDGPPPPRKLTFLEKKGLVPLKDENLFAPRLAPTQGKPKQTMSTDVHWAETHRDDGERPKAISDNTLGPECPPLSQDGKERRRSESNRRSGICNPLGDSPNVKQGNELRDSQESVCSGACSLNLETGPELAEFLCLWPRLAEGTQQALLALARSAANA